MNHPRQDTKQLTGKLSVWQRSWFLMGCVLLLSTVINLYGIGHSSLESDELFSLYDAREIKIFANRPLYYIILSLWMQVSSEESWLRGLSVLCTLGALILTYQLGATISGRATGVLAATLMAISPVLVHQSQYVRMYTLGNLLIVAGSLVLSRWLWRGLTHRGLGLWVFLRFLAVLTIPLSVSILLADLILLWSRFYKQRASLLKILIWFLGLLALCLPFLLLLVSAKSSYEGTWGSEVEPPALSILWQYLKTFAYGDYLSLHGRNLLYRFYKAMAMVLVLLLASAVIRKHRDARPMWIVAWLCLPVLFLFTVASLSSLELLERYIMFASPFLFILLAAGFVRLFHFQPAVMVALLLLYLTAVGGQLGAYYTSYDSRAMDWRGANLAISNDYQAGDAIAISIINSRTCPFITHYFQEDAPIYAIEDFKSNNVNEQTLDNFVRAIPVAQSRVWLLLRQPLFFENHLTELEKLLEQYFSITVKNSFYKAIHLYLLEPQPSIRENMAASKLSKEAPSDRVRLNCTRKSKILLVRPPDQST